MTPDFDLDTATERVQGILRGKVKSELNSAGTTSIFTLPEVPAAVQEAGDKAWADSALSQKAVDSMRALVTGFGATRKKRADAGKPRPTPQPAPEPETQAQSDYRISQDEAAWYKAFPKRLAEKREEFAAIEKELELMQAQWDHAIDSLAK